MLVPGVIIGFGETINFYQAAQAQLLQQARGNNISNDPNSQYFIHVFARMLQLSPENLWLHLSRFTVLAGGMVMVFIASFRMCAWPRGALSAIPAQPHSAKLTMPARPHSAKLAAPARPHSAKLAAPARPHSAKLAAPARPHSAKLATPARPHSAKLATPARPHSAKLAAPARPHSAKFPARAWFAALPRPRALAALGRRFGNAWATVPFLPEFSYAILFLLTPLLLLTSWPHYFSYLPFCQLVLLKLVLTGSQPGWSKLGCLLLVATSVILASTPFFFQWPQFRPYTRTGMLLHANLLLLLGFGWYFMQHLQARDAHQLRQSTGTG